MFKKTSISIVIYLFNLNLWSQEQLPVEQKIFISPDNKIYINKAQPIYFSVSNSPDPNAPSYVLPSENTPKYANPMYFDTEGRNTLRSPWAIDKVTHQPVNPKTEIQFDIYADGIAPLSNMKFIGKQVFKDNKVYFNKSVKIQLTAFDATSGIETSYISINGSPFTDYQKFSQELTEEKEYTVKYYAVDHVGNLEKVNTKIFYIDNTAPVSTFQILGENKGNVISSKASIKLESKDTLSGVEKLVYSINDGPFVNYTVPIPIKVLHDAKSKITYYAIDRCGNKEESKVIATFAGNMDEDADRSSYGYYIDKDPPVISFEIDGDKYSSNYLYISERSKCKINATDDKSGVDKISYSIDNLTLKNTFTEPFTFSQSGLHSIFFAATDYVGNAAVMKSQQIYLDILKPETKILFEGSTFVNRDTLFITSTTTIKLKATDQGSGCMETIYKTDNAAEVNYNNPILLNSEGLHSIEYYTRDKVNNQETLKEKKFVIDNTPPNLFTRFSVTAIGEKIIRNEKYIIYPSNTMLYIAATDNASGTDHIEYRINGNGPWLKDLPLKGFSPGNYEIEIVCWDVLKNKSIKFERFAIEN